MKIKVREKMENISKVTVYIDDNTMSASDVVCIVSHLARYGTLTGMSAFYPFTDITLAVMNEDLEEMIEDITNDGFLVTMI